MKLNTHGIKYLLTFIFIIIFINGNSQTFDLYISNDHLTAPNIFEFDVYMKGTSTDVQIHYVQQSFTINPAFTPSGPAPTISSITGSTQFNSYFPGLIQQNSSPSLSAFQGGTNQGGSCPGMGIIGSSIAVKRVCTWRIISNSGSFNCVPHNLSMIRPIQDVPPGGNVNVNFAILAWETLNCSDQILNTISTNGIYTSIPGNTLLSQMNNFPEDNNLCTIDACDVNGNPTHTPITGTADDNNVCTTGETCNNGVFIAGTLVSTDDNDVCTIDNCDPISGVSHIQAKEDNNPCTDDFCNPSGVVSHTSTAYGTPGQTDNNPCTNDICDGNNTTIHVQTCSGVTLYAKLFIEGFYTGSIGNIMDNVYLPPYGGLLYHVAASTFIEDVDFVNISAMAKNAPYGFIESKTGILKRNGSIQVTFSNLVSSGVEYWIRIRHRNSIETWSAAAVEFSATSATAPYDFTSAQTKAYGNNLSDMGDGYWAIFSGDISDAGTANVGVQDGIIESQDYGDMENAVYYTYLGYITEDITGDGIVDSGDYGLMENNTYFTRVVKHP